MFSSNAFLRSLRERTVAAEQPADLTPAPRLLVKRPRGHLSLEAQPEAGVGGQLWDAACVLADHLEPLAAGRTVCELGAGTGALGLSVALAGAASVVLSDRFDVMPLLARNVAANAVPDCVVTVQEISWGEPVARAAVAPDWIIASEVVYNGLLYDKLLATMRALSGPSTQMFMSYECRSSEDRWRAMMEAAYESVAVVQYPWGPEGQRTVHVMHCQRMRTVL